MGDKKNISGRLLSSSLILFAIRLFHRVVGLVSTLILARTLTPEHYGVVAIATLVVYFFDALSETGRREYIIQKADLCDQDIDTAWTFNLVLKGILWLVFFVASPYVADFYDEPSLTYVFWFMSSIIIFTAVQSPGLDLYQKELNYKPLFYLSVVEKLSAFGVLMLLLVFWRQDYWVMAISMVVGNVVLMIGSYYVHPYRPKFSLGRFQEQWSFSKWVIPQGFLGFTKAEIDVFIVTKFFGLAGAGGFNLIKSLTSTVARDVIMPATEPLLAAFSESKGDRQRHSYQISLSLFVMFCVVVPITAFMYLYSDLLILVLYGDQWLEYASVMSAFSFIILIYSFSGIAQRALYSLSMTKSIFIYELLSVLVTAAVLITASSLDLDEFSYLRVSLVAALLLGLLVFLFRVTGLRFTTHIILYFPGLFALLLASFASFAIYGYYDLHYMLEFFIVGSVFTLVYALVLILMLRPYRSTEEVSYLIWLFNTKVLPVLNRYLRRDER